MSEEIDFKDEDEKEEDATGRWLQPPVYKEDTIVPSQNDSVNHLIALAGAYDYIVIVACHCGVIAGLIVFSPQSKLFSRYIYRLNPVMLTFLFNKYYWIPVIFITGMQYGISNFSHLSVIMLLPPVIISCFPVMCSTSFFNNFYIFFNNFYIHQ
jgi:hypothetical protein